MSAIAGLVVANGRHADILSVRQMLEAMPRRAREGIGIFHDVGVALGQAQAPTVAAGEGATLPWVSGQLAIVADARLDNREDLLAALRSPADAVSDPALILSAYRRWGEECVRYLLGDFSFALWDGEHRRLFCARDHFGVKPFYFCRPRGDFAFGSEIKALFARPEISRDIDEARIGDFLVGLPPDAGSTFYTSIASLPAAHSLTVSADNLVVRRYWELRPSATSVIDAPEQFRHLFTTAVKCRLRGANEVGAMLSGGLDSSSIACVAAPLAMRQTGRPLPTFSIVFDATPKWSERPFVESVLARGGFDPTFLNSDGYAPFADFEDILGEQDGIFPAPGLAVTRKVLRAAADRGVGVLLDGHGGDEVISHGEGRLRELAQANRWLALWSEVRGLAAIDGDPVWPAMAAHFERYGPGRYLRPARRLAARALRTLHRRWDAPGRPDPLASVNSGFAARVDLAARYREKMSAMAMAGNADEAERHRQVIASPMTEYAFEVLDKTGASAGIELRYPFFDKRLVEFCVGLPASEKLSGGWSRLVLRRAMQDILPADIQWRRDKLDFSPHIVRGMLANHGAMLDGIQADVDGVGRYVDLSAIRAAYLRIRERREAVNGADVQIVWRTAALSLWLRRLQSVPSDAFAAA